MRIGARRTAARPRRSPLVQLRRQDAGAADHRRAGPAGVGHVAVDGLDARRDRHRRPEFEVADDRGGRLPRPGHGPGGVRHRQDEKRRIASAGGPVDRQRLADRPPLLLHGQAVGITLDDRGLRSERHVERAGRALRRREGGRVLGDERDEVARLGRRPRHVHGDEDRGGGPGGENRPAQRDDQPGVRRGRAAGAGGRSLLAHPGVMPGIAGSQPAPPLRLRRRARRRRPSAPASSWGSGGRRACGRGTNRSASRSWSRDRRSPGSGPGRAPA